MLLCIEVYPPPVTDVTTTTSTSTSTVTDTIPLLQQVQQVQPLGHVQYASLLGNTIRDNNNSSTSNNNDGIVWSTGRRSGNYQLVTDKTVSREHCIVIIGTTNANFISNSNSEQRLSVTNDESTIPGSTSTSTSTINDSFGCNPLLLVSQSQSQSLSLSSTVSDPNTLEANTVCNQSKDQLCVLLQNVGKLGTFIIEEYYHNEEEDDDTNDDQANDDDDNECRNNTKQNNNSDSETDDEIEAFIRSQQYNKSQQQKQKQQQQQSDAMKLNKSTISTTTSTKVGPMYTTTESFNEMSQQLYGVTLSPISEYLIFHEENNSTTGSNNKNDTNDKNQNQNQSHNTICKRGIESIIPITVVNEMKVIQSLALLNDSSTSTNSSCKQNKQQHNTKLKRCIIQIGKLGTTIVITRMPSFHFIPSGPNTKQILDHYSTVLYKIGCYTYNNNNTNNITSSNSNSNNSNNSNRINVRNLLDANEQYRIVPWKKKKSSSNKNTTTVGNTAITSSNNNTLKDYMIQNYSSCYDVCYIVITTQYIASLKQLIAWACGIPIVSSSFIHSLFTSISTLSSSTSTTTTSSSSSLLLPSIHDHIPQSDSNIFWKQYPNPLLWKNYALLSLSASSTTTSHLKGQQQQQQDNEYDLEQLILAGGATIVPILSFISKEQQQQQNEITKKILIETVQRIIQMSPTDIFKKITCSSSTTRGCKKDNIVEKLNYFVFGNDSTSSTQISIPISSSSSNIVSNFESILVQEFSTNITQITAKHIAKSITTQTTILFPVTITAASSTNTTTTTKMKEIENKQHIALAGSRNSNNNDNNSSIVVNRNTDTNVKNVTMIVDTVQSSIVANDQSNKNEKQQKQQQPVGNTSSSSASAASVDKRGDDVVHSSPMASSQLQHQEMEGPSQSKVYIDLPASNRPPAIANNISNKSTIDKIAVVTSSSNSNSSSISQGSNNLSNKKQIINQATTKRIGWYEALPKHRTGRTKEEMRLQLVNKINNEEVGEIRDVAVTESIKGLIIVNQFNSANSTTNNTSSTSTGSTNNNNSITTTIPDFKTFRKNSIAGVPNYNDTKHRTNNNTNSNKRSIRLISVLPKEADNRRDIEEQQRTLDEQERRADSLFQETSNTMTSRRRT